MNKKLTAIFAILMVSLMLAGVSYALWSKTIYIHGTVDTGDLDAEITYWFSNDPGTTIDPGYTKHVGWVVCTIDPIDPQKAYLEIHNGYPSYRVHYSITILNTGNVPWKMQSITVDGTPLPNNVWVPMDLDSDGTDDIEFRIIDSIGEQAEHGESVETSLDTHVLQGAHESFHYTFTISFLLVQWNEYVPP
jgi:hypothetical protein